MGNILGWSSTKVSGISLRGAHRAARKLIPRLTNRVSPEGLILYLPLPDPLNRHVYVLKVLSKVLSTLGVITLWLSHLPP